MAGDLLRDWKMVAAFVLLLVAACLVLARLGHYALWDDEAETALFGQAIMATGDTSAIIGHNIEAFDGGKLLTDLRERFNPPLPYYLAATSLGLFGPTAWAARLPFAICGVLSFALLLYWLIRDRVDSYLFWLTAIGLLSNVSLILYFRQCRYYAIVILLSISLAYLYVHWNNSWTTQGLIILLFSGLLATQYIAFAAAGACIVVDWLIWGKKTIKPGWRLITIVVLLQAIITVLFLQVYNPFHPAPPPMLENVSYRLECLWWNIRDLSVNEFWILPVLIVIPLVWGYCRRDQWLLRGGLATLVYFLSVTVVAPHGTGNFSEIRYFCGMIPLAIALEARVIRIAAGSRAAMSILVGVPILATNALSGSQWAPKVQVVHPLQCTLVSFLEELWNPPPDPYTAAAAWLAQNVAADSTVLALPSYTTYPLMFRAPQLIYAWQLSDPPAPQFSGLPDIYFAHRIMPQYVILFGAEGFTAAAHELPRQPGQRVSFSLVHTIPIFGKDLYRPELFLHQFRARAGSLNHSAIYIFRRSERL